MSDDLTSQFKPKCCTYKTFVPDGYQPAPSQKNMFSSLILNESHLQIVQSFRSSLTILILHLKINVTDLKIRQTFAVSCIKRCLAEIQRMHKNIRACPYPENLNTCQQPTDLRRYDVSTAFISGNMRNEFNLRGFSYLTIPPLKVT